MIHVLAIVTAKPGQREAVLAEFRANMAAVHAEAGCIHYEPVIDAETMRLHHDKRDLATDLLEGAEATARLSEDELLGLIRR